MTDHLPHPRTRYAGGQMPLNAYEVAEFDRAPILNAIRVGARAVGVTLCLCGVLAFALMLRSLFR